MLLRTLPRMVARCQLAASGGGVAAAKQHQPCLLRQRRRCFQRGRFCYHDVVDYHDDDDDGSTTTGKSSAKIETPCRRQVPDDIRNHSTQSSLDRLQTTNSLRCKILRNTCISRHHLTPEIALRLITAECDIYHRPMPSAESSEEEGGHGFDLDPFWGFYWPGGQALTRFILDNRHRFEGRRVLDVGCGCGASSIAARLAAASHVIANDIDHAALEATRINAELNQITAGLELDHRNRIGDVTGSYDVVLIGDLFYDTEIADLLLPWLAALTKRKTEIYVGDPGRHGLTGSEGRFGGSMTQLARYELPANVCIENNGFSHATVWKFEQRSR